MAIQFFTKILIFGSVVVIGYLNLVESSTTEAKIPSFLLDCYRDLTRDDLLPMTSKTLISLIRKAEDKLSGSVNLKSLSTSILAKFRYDGIERDPYVQSSSFIIPYASSGNEFYLYSLLFDQLLPTTGQAQQIPNNTFTQIEKCTLHFMLSNSVDRWRREDNDASCNFASKVIYDEDWDSRNRFPRSVNTRKIRNIEKLDEVDVFDQYSEIRGIQQRSPYLNNYQYMAAGDDFPISSCPIENGVILTQSGEISPGIVIAGIVAATQYESVTLNTFRTHFRGSLKKKTKPGIRNPEEYYRRGNNQRNNNQYPRFKRSPQYNNYPPSYQPPNQYGGGANPRSSLDFNPQRGIYANNYPPSNGQNIRPDNSNNNNDNNNNNNNNPVGPRQFDNTPFLSKQPDFFGNDKIENIWASTISGLLGYTVLLLGPKDPQITQIGIDGHWNDTFIPKYYFLTDNTKDALTGSRIKGAVDGIILASLLSNGQSSFSNLQLSQLLDMYYSNHGYAKPDFNSCNRKTLLNQIVHSADMSSQTTVLALALAEVLPSVTLADQAVNDFSTTASNKLQSYIANLPTSAKCSSTNSKNVLYSIPAPDLTLVIDFSRDYTETMRIIQYIVDNVEINKFGGNLTVINAKDGSVIVNATHNILEFYNNFNITMYRNSATTFDMSYVMNRLKLLFIDKQNQDKSLGAKGVDHTQIVLFIPYTSKVVTDNNKQYILDKIKFFHNHVPDLRFMFLAVRSKDEYSDFVIDKDKDTYILNPGSIPQSLNPVIERIKTLPHRMFNPTCGSLWSASQTGSLTSTMYINPMEIQYFRLNPNYFYYVSPYVKITIRSESGTPLTICQSRHNMNPSKNGTSNSGTNCTQVSGGNQFDIFLDYYSCNSAKIVSQCDPLYTSISVPQPSSSQAIQSTCTDATYCRFPDILKYTITLQGMICQSFATTLMTSSYLFLMLLTLSIFNR